MTSTSPDKGAGTGTSAADSGEKDKLDRASEQLEKISSVLSNMGPVGDGALTGSVTLAAKSGTLGGWLAHRELATAAETIATGALVWLTNEARVMVVDSRELLGEDASGARARDWMTVATDRLEHLIGEVNASRDAFNSSFQRLAATNRELPSDVLKRMEAIAKGEEPAAHPTPGTTPRAPADGLVVVASEDSSRAAPPAEETETPAPSGGLAGALLGLLALAREDYDLGAVEVTAGSTELSTLVAGYLIQKAANTTASVGMTVEVDNFRAAGSSPTLASYRNLTTKLDALADALGALSAVVTPTEDRRDALQLRRDALEKKWTEAVVAKDTPAGAGDQLLQRMTELADQQRRLDESLTPIGNLVAGRTSILESIRGRLTELTTAPSAGGLAPLAEAVRHERLSLPAGESHLTHVLYVHVDALGGDTVTRKTLLGEPGRLGFLGSVNSSWLLATAEGRVFGGAAAEGAASLTYDLRTGQASLKPIDTLGEITRTARDTLATWTPALVVVVMLAVLLFAAAPILEVLLSGR